MKLKRILSCVLATGLLFSAPTKVNQVSASAMGRIAVAFFTSFAAILPTILYQVVYLLEIRQTESVDMREREQYGGFRNPQEIINKLDEIVHNKSEIKIYGQEKAKKQAHNALCSIIARLHNIARSRVNRRDLRGNIIYLIGPSGTGKTTLCHAIADAFLKCPNKSSLVCQSESISSGTDLGSQLFKTIITKDIGQRRQWSAFFNHNGLIPKEEESPALKHILKWHEGVIIIDEFDKMKLLTKNNKDSISTTEVHCDKSADEILRSIASTGGYTFMNKWIDCSNILFLVTTNETREELQTNFGIGGVKGGGAQRLNIVEFEELSMDACRLIVKDIIQNVGDALVDNTGLYRLYGVNIDNESAENMARYIFDDKVMQGRAKCAIENEIYSLFSSTIGKDSDKNIKLSCDYSSETHEIKFTKTVINDRKEKTALSEDEDSNKNTKLSCDYSSKIHEIKFTKTAIDDRKEKTTSFKDRLNEEIEFSECA